MSLKKISKEQPSDFEFNKTNLEEAQKIIKNYPEEKKQSAVWVYLTQIFCVLGACGLITTIYDIVKTL